MSVFSVRPRVNDLVFRVYGRPVHPELFEILESRTYQREDYELTLSITRTGHVNSWHNRSQWLTEVTATTEQPLPSSRRLLGYRIRGEHGGSVSCGEALNYQMIFQVETLRPDLYLQIHDEIVADGAKR